MSVFHLNVHLTKRVCFSPVAENAQLRCCLRGATEGKFRKKRVNWKVGGKKEHMTSTEVMLKVEIL